MYINIYLSSEESKCQLPGRWWKSLDNRHILLFILFPPNFHSLLHPSFNISSLFQTTFSQWLFGLSFIRRYPLKEFYHSLVLVMLTLKSWRRGLKCHLIAINSFSQNLATGYFNLLLIFSIFNLLLLQTLGDGYSEQSCGNVWAPNVRLTGHPTTNVGYCEWFLWYVNSIFIVVPGRVNDNWNV